MTTPILLEHETDAELWQRVCEGSTAAFEVLVLRHQSLVCAVAYNACGNLALSEDVAQETFWTAWRERTSLKCPDRLRAWLCGIARNIGQNARRRAARPADSAFPLDGASEMASSEAGPAEAMVSREEADLIWQTLEQVPELYREPLILFYREEKPVAEVAAVLDLSENAVKQRLSRGREMLREGVAELVEGVLRRSRPGRGLTVAVMAGLTAVSVGAKTALAEAAGQAAAGMAGPAVKAVAASGLTGALGGILGSLVGLAGGWLGAWVPAQLAPTRRERDLIVRTGWRMLLVSVLFTVVLVGVGLHFAGRMAPGHYLVFWAGWMVSYWAYLLVEILRINREVKRIRADTATAEPNDAALRRRLLALSSRYRGRTYRSRARFLGLPLIDINVGDPALSGGPGALPRERRTARGWIAIGDDARGVLAIGGSMAVGLVAFGGRLTGRAELWRCRRRACRIRRACRGRAGFWRSRGRLAGVRRRRDRRRRGGRRRGGRLAWGGRRGGHCARFRPWRRCPGAARQ